MKLPYSVSGADLIKSQKRLGYEQICEIGSYIRISLQQPKQYHFTMPNHTTNKVVKLAAIVTDKSALQ